jgi:hypothetical protein
MNNIGIVVFNSSSGHQHGVVVGGWWLVVGDRIGLNGKKNK